MSEDKKENKINDQASRLRKKMEVIKGDHLDEVHFMESSLPPRRTVHRKAATNLGRLGLLFFFILLIVFIIVWYLFIYRGVPSATDVASVAWENTDSSIPIESNELNAENNDTSQNIADQNPEGSADLGKEGNKEKKDVQYKEQTGYEKIVSHRVKAGETLYSITMYYYKDKRYVPFLAEYNRIENPRNIVAGIVIKVPLPPPPLGK